MPSMMRDVSHSITQSVVHIQSCKLVPVVVGTSVVVFVGRFVGDMYDIGSIFTSNDQKMH